MALIPDSELREARDVLSIFTEARPGGAVMDGRGQIWHFDGVGGWYFEDRRVEPLTLAKALNPDLAEASIHVPVWFPAHDIRADLTPLARQHFVDGAVWAAARVTPTREQIAMLLCSMKFPESACSDELFCEEAIGSHSLEIADAVLALIKQLAGGD